MRFRGPVVTSENRAEGTRRSALLWPRQRRENHSFTSEQGRKEKDVHSVILTSFPGIAPKRVLPTLDPITWNLPAVPWALPTRKTPDHKVM